MKNENLLKVFAKYVSLNVLGMIALSCYILADTFFVSKALGAAGLAALNLAIPVYNFIHGSGLMIGMGGGTKYSIYKGSGRSGFYQCSCGHDLYCSHFLFGRTFCLSADCTLFRGK